MRRWIVFQLMGLAVGLAGCASDDGTEYYSPELIDVRHVAFDGAGRLSLDYRAAAETCWYCPGADVDRDGDTLVFAFQRAWFRDDALPDAGRVRIGEDDHLEVTSVGDIRRIVVTDGDQHREVWRDGRFVSR